MKHLCSWFSNRSNPVLHNNALHQTGRGGAVASRPVVEARPAGERECYLCSEAASKMSGSDFGDVAVEPFHKPA